MSLIDHIDYPYRTGRQSLVVLHKDEGESAVYPGRANTITKVTAKDNEGYFSLNETIVEPGCVVPPHIHFFMNEQFYVVDGELEFLAGEQRVTGRPGTFISIPRGLVHAWGNVTDKQSRLLILFAPDVNRERYFARIAQFMKVGMDLDEAERYVLTIAEEMRNGAPNWKDLKEQLDLEFDSVDPEPRIKFP